MSATNRYGEKVGREKVMLKINRGVDQNYAQEGPEERSGRMEVRSEVEEEKVTLDRPDSNNARNRGK